MLRGSSDSPPEGANAPLEGSNGSPEAPMSRCEAPTLRWKAPTSRWMVTTKRCQGEMRCRFAGLRSAAAKKGGRAGGTLPETDRSNRQDQSLAATWDGGAADCEVRVEAAGVSGVGVGAGALALRPRKGCRSNSVSFSERGP